MSSNQQLSNTWTDVHSGSLDICRLHIFTRLQSKFEEAITPSVEAALNPCLHHPCQRSARAAHYLIELCQLGLWPLTDVLTRKRISIRMVLTKLRRFKDFSPPKNSCFCFIDTESGEKIRSLAREFVLKGLCLNCVKSGRLGVMEDNCMVAPKMGICGHQGTIK